MPLVGIEMNRRSSSTVEEGISCDLNIRTHERKSLKKLIREKKSVAGLG